MILIENITMRMKGRGISLIEKTTEGALRLCSGRFRFFVFVVDNPAWLFLRHKKNIQFQRKARPGRLNLTTTICGGILSGKTTKYGVLKLYAMPDLPLSRDKSH